MINKKHHKANIEELEYYLKLLIESDKQTSYLLNAQGASRIKVLLNTYNFILDFINADEAKRKQSIEILEYKLNNNKIIKENDCDKSKQREVAYEYQLKELQKQNNYNRRNKERLWNVGGICSG